MQSHCQPRRITEELISLLLLHFRVCVYFLEILSRRSSSAKWMDGGLSRMEAEERRRSKARRTRERERDNDYFIGLLCTRRVNTIVQFIYKHHITVIVYQTCALAIRLAERWGSYKRLELRRFVFTSAWSSYNKLWITHFSFYALTTGGVLSFITFRRQFAENRPFLN